MSEPPFLIRPADVSDVSGLVPLWLESTWRSTYARAYRCDEPTCLRCTRGSTRFEDVSRCKQKPVFWSVHEPRVQRLLQRSEVRVACDAIEPAALWAFCCIEGDKLHHLLAKRWCHGAGLTVELFGRLLGEDYNRPLSYSHEIVDLRRDDVKASGWVLPPSWRYDPMAVMEAA